MAKVGVRRAAAGEGELAGHQRREGPVVSRGDGRAAVDERHLRHGGGIGVGPLQLLGGPGAPGSGRAGRRWPGRWARAWTAAR